MCVSIVYYSQKERKSAGKKGAIVMKKNITIVSTGPKRHEICYRK